ncbi:MAG: DUF2997 domain-containing protein [Planctomycetia bacterium]|nr:DUF2997 domain-containing protein [Planctomycetia bacterium]
MQDRITGNAVFKIVEVVVSPTGEIVIRTKGFVGTACRDGSRFLEEALGRCQNERLTTESHQALPVDGLWVNR